jgi:hypothetical protein
MVRSGRLSPEIHPAMVADPAMRPSSRKGPANAYLPASACDLTRFLATHQKSDEIVLHFLRNVEVLLRLRSVWSASAINNSNTEFKTVALMANLLL